MLSIRFWETWRRFMNTNPILGGQSRLSRSCPATTAGTIPVDRRKTADGESKMRSQGEVVFLMDTALWSLKTRILRVPLADLFGLSQLRHIQKVEP